MLVYLELAAISHERRQSVGRNKLLVLAGAEALRAGWPDVAERCRSLVVADNPAHLLGRFGTFAEAMRSSEFAPLLLQHERFCSFERAEMLLSGQGRAVAAVEDAGQKAAAILDGRLQS
jgi:hypothetical protein